MIQVAAAVVQREWRVQRRYPISMVNLALLTPLYQLALPTLLPGTAFLVGGASVGLGRAMPSARWASRLIGVYGMSLVAAGVFRADPALGFPVGTPADARDVSWHGLAHLACGAIGFACLIAACVLLGRHLARSGQRGWARFTRVTGVVFLAAFIGIASGAATAVTTLGFVTAVILMCAWMSAFATHLYRTV